ncbi:SDR family NAD(P)-dependent oxidoreductase [Salinibacterium sp. ZJ454]|uniref:SDR family NAD(P)-dependent oxidoreductase n=1 Tax=Salinibacterium sp. ZJ454 TaxID=2708339 RepID=UPI0014210758|nr:SDR family NAD(P)-dependent oxidoreductase [Salinibacterium sp. ZJ454]
MMNARRFAEKSVLVIGAAQGIGRATAQAVLAEGGTVMGVDLSPMPVGTHEGLTADSGGRFVGHVADALDGTQVQTAVDFACDLFGGVDVLVNAVGGSSIVAEPGRHVDDMPFTDWKRVIDFNLSGTFLFSQSVIPVMKEGGGGKIVNVSSLAHRGRSEDASAAYAVSKAGIVALTTKLALEVGPFGITVNAIAPSLTLTERLKPHWSEMSEAKRDDTLSRIPLGRLAKSSDSAKVICFLASADADFVSGVTIDVAGGQ